MRWLLLLLLSSSAMLAQKNDSPQDWLLQEAYPDARARETNLERDLATMWGEERVAGRTYSTIPARSAARRVFADVQLRFSGSPEDLQKFLDREPHATRDQVLIYRIEAPAYTDEYQIVFVNQQFQKVMHRKIPRMMQPRN